jgi:hypothetical protein
MVDTGLSRSLAALDGLVRTFVGIALPCLTYEYVERSGQQSSCTYHLHTSTTLRRPPSTNVHNTQAPAILGRPPSSHARYPHTLHVLEPRLRKTSATTSNVRHLQLSNACLRIGMEDDTLHFPDGVHEDDRTWNGDTPKRPVVLISEPRV